MELVELHVLQRQALAVDDGHAVAGRGCARWTWSCTRGRSRRWRTRRTWRGRCGSRRWTARRPTTPAVRAPVDLVEQEVQHVVLVVELHVVLDAVLVQRLQDHVPGAVRGVAGTAHGGLAVVAGVPAEAALVDPALGGAVERQAHLLQVDDRVDGLLAHDLGGVLVDQVVAALDRVEGVPLPVVLLDVGQCGAHAALGGAGVRAGRVELGQHRGADPGPGLERRAHPGAAGADDHDVVGVVLHGWRHSPIRRCWGRR